ncbi:MAG TPA: hypothetical protein VF753_04120 [Terriglobales bacterium]
MVRALGHASIWAFLAALVLLGGAAWAQTSPATAADVDRQSLNDAWWTGPMLAPNASTLPQGHFLLEPYVYDVITQGEYDANGKRQSSPHENGFGNLTYMNYGLANKFTVGIIPTFGYNVVSEGPNSSGLGFGDLTAQAQYRLRQFNEGSWLPTVSFALQETFPTGKYDELGDRTSDGLGAGAYTTTLALYSQTYFWMPNGRILRTRFNVTQAFSRHVDVRDASVYGTEDGFRGQADPGAVLFVDAAWEYSVTRSWVLALDATYRHQYNTPVNGYYVTDPNQPVGLNSGSSQAFGLAPAIEYNWKRNLGVLLGVRVIPAGKNTSQTISPAIAINFVH